MEMSLEREVKQLREDLRDMKHSFEQFAWDQKSEMRSRQWVDDCFYSDINFWLFMIAISISTATLVFVISK